MGQWVMRSNTNGTMSNMVNTNGTMGNMAKHKWDHEYYDKTQTGQWGTW